jgi:hypothetical protein
MYSINNGNIIIDDDCRVAKEIFRLATDSEVGMFIRVLAKNGLNWNATKKRIEKIRRRAEHGGTYYTCGYQGLIHEPVDFTDNRSSSGDQLYNAGDYFLDKSDCQRLCDKLNDVVKNFE